MDTRLATNQIRLQEWTAIIQDRCNSGLTIEAYCQSHNLSKGAYYYWLHKVKEAALTHAGFVEVTALESAHVKSTTQIEPVNFNPSLVLTVNGVQLQINEATSASLLARVIEVLRRAE